VSGANQLVWLELHYLRGKQMSNPDLLSRISINPNICVGKPCIRGHRIWVSLILDYLAAGETIEGLLEAYPSLDRADVLACIAYGVEPITKKARDDPHLTVPYRDY
jgi:uncharacterized protein (DUF433 family)